MAEIHTTYIIQLPHPSYSFSSNLKKQHTWYRNCFRYQNKLRSNQNGRKFEAAGVNKGAYQQWGHAAIHDPVNLGGWFVNDDDDDKDKRFQPCGLKYTHLWCIVPQLDTSTQYSFPQVVAYQGVYAAAIKMYITARSPMWKKFFIDLQQKSSHTITLDVKIHFDSLDCAMALKYFRETCVNDTRVPWR